MADSVSEADFSEEQSAEPMPAETGTGIGTTETSDKTSELKKKERIRDNQRRSRARRQEHLADLEKRVAASHAACREAEMQRGALRDAQIENMRLRELLRIAGVEEQVVQAYVNQGMRAMGAGAGDKSQRTLRPRMEDHRRDSDRAGRRSADEGGGSRRTSPYPDSGRLEVDAHGEGSLARLSPSSLPSSYSPTTTGGSSHGLSMPAHMLHGGVGHMPHLDIFQPTLPQREDDSCWSGFEISSNDAWRS